MMFDLTGKVAVVTGGSRGIGRSICEQMAAHGAKVVVSSRKLPACEEVVKGIKARGGEATAVAASISDKAQLENLVASARKTYGRIDIMVCNAASNPYFGPLTGLKEEVFAKIMQNNVMSNLWLMNMVGTGDGRAEGRRVHRRVVDRRADRLGAHRRLQHEQGGRPLPGEVARHGMGQAQHPRQRHRARPDPDRLRQGAVGQSRHPHAPTRARRR